MTDEQALGLCVFGAILVVSLLVLLITHEVRKGPAKKPNIRVPRETLWERTNRYHEDRS